ncbi:MAG: hypothetical protein JNJ85_01510 [Candidatus Kapabacteria bacterium]|nr:hypothetical protein [Candidatus Kapabacteria bacterium]
MTTEPEEFDEQQPRNPDRDNEQPPRRNNYGDRGERPDRNRPYQQRPFRDGGNQREGNYERRYDRREGGAQNRNDRSRNQQREGFTPRGGDYRGNRDSGYQRREGDRFNPERREGFRRDDNRSGGYQRRPYENRGDRPRGERSEFREFNNYDRRRPMSRRAKNEMRARDGYDQHTRQPPPQRPTTLIKALVRLVYGSRGVSMNALHDSLVTVNDILTTSPNKSVRILQDIIKVNGVFLMHNPRNIYIVLNKPKKIAGSREYQSRNIMNLMVKKRGWHIPCGPLAKSCSGIVVLTNDPEQRHAEHNMFALMEKEYWFKVHKKVLKKDLEVITKAVRELHPENKEIAKAELAQKNTRNSWISITVRHARIHDMNRILKQNGFEILATERRRIGSLSVTDLPSGSWRRLDEDELQIIFTDSVKIQQVEERVGEERTEEASTTEQTGVWQKLFQRWFKSI